MENQEFTPSFFRFEDLRVYQKALDYYTWTQINTEMFPHAETNTLVKSFVIDSLEIASKISEGSSRNKSHFITNLKDAKTAIRRCVVYTTVAFKLGYFSEDEEGNSRTQLMELTKMIGALIGSLQRDYHSNSNRSQDSRESVNDY
ncbi:MAG: four helix bundle protein [Bacteroidales bacterium]|nr:four helix bundle protein [Bacteroidales bacterium]